MSGNSLGNSVKKIASLLTGGGKPPQETQFSSQIPVMDIDPYDADLLVNMEPYFDKLRGAGPFVYIPKYNILVCGRYKEVQEVFSDWKRFVSSRGVGLEDFKKEKPWRPPSLILEVDPPDHTKTRSVMMRAMSPKAVSKLKDTFQKEADKLIDELVARGEFDAVKDLAEAFPLKVFPDAVGLESDGREKLLEYGAMVFNSVGPDNDVRKASFKNADAVIEYIASKCDRGAVSSEGFAATIYAAADAGEISEHEASMLVRSLLSAGVDTTVTGIGSALFCLAHNPDQYILLKDDPSLARQTFEEVLRYTYPVHSFFRTADLDTEVSGIPIPEGTKILCVLGSANRDEEKFPNADQFDIMRRPIGHVAFGTGIHGCVGQAVARMEAEVVLKAITQRVERIELTATPIWQPNNAIHTLASMPVRFVAK